MKSKAFFLALSCFAFSAAFAQDTPKTPKPDTTKWPKHDSSLVKHIIQPVKPGNSTFNATTLFMINNENKLAAKKESTNDITI